MKRLISLFFLIVSVVHNTLAVDYLYNQQNGCIGVQWVYDDMCGIFTVSNTHTIQWVTQGNMNSCTLYAYGWSLAPNSQYYAYYPCSLSYTTNGDRMTALPISYVGQKQTQNNSTSHLDLYDYMTAQSMSTNNSCHFCYSHLGSVLRIECTLPEAKLLKKLMLYAERDVFVKTATMNVIDNSLTPTIYGKDLNLDLDKISIKEGERFVAYMMLPASDLTNTEFIVELTATDGSECRAKVKGTRVLSGRVYPISLKMSSFEQPKSKKQAVFVSSSSNESNRYSPSLLLNSGIQEPTAYAPDFMVDMDNVFEQIPYKSENDIATDIIEKLEVGRNSQDIFTINGVKVPFVRKGMIYIHNGKKHRN